MRVCLAEGGGPALDLLAGAVRDHGVFGLEIGLFLVVGCQGKGDEKEQDEPAYQPYMKSIILG